ncbi:hypothetical protein Vretimale_13638 [Volvox reticuliferus]|nr:hypothetical protein Vretifemale_481 [Volvox reticuliferus]GIM09828.1 hypothetical protein Vretimale_13638 [Volvox reticuliferus]
MGGDVGELPGYLLWCSNDACDSPSDAGYGAVLIGFMFDEEGCDAEQPPADGSNAVVSVERTVFSNNTGGCGAGISVRAPIPVQGCPQGNVHFTVVNSKITYNTASRDGGGIYYGSCMNDLLFMDVSNATELSDNSALGRSGGGGGAAIYSHTIDSLNITDSGISQNKGNANGGGVYVVAYNGISSITIERSNLTRNNASGFGGAVHVRAPYGVVESIRVGGGSILQSNYAGRSGGAASFRLWGADKPTTLTLDGGSVVSNNVVQGHGGAIALEGYGEGFTAHLNIMASTFVKNQAMNGNGGAVYWLLQPGSAGNFTIGNNATLLENAAYSSGAKGASCGDGGGIYIHTQKCGSPTSNMFIVGQARFASNTAERHGGAVYMECADGRDNRILSFNESTFDGNVALTGSGGAVYITQTNGLISKFTLSESSFRSNAASCLGGAIYLELLSDQPSQAMDTDGLLGQLLITTNSTLANNSVAGSVGGMTCALENISHDGGAIYLAVQRIDLPLIVANSSSILSNSASGGGGAVYIHNVAPQSGLVISGGSHISYNTAGGIGGAFALRDATWNGTIEHVVHIEDRSVVSYNGAGSDGGFLYMFTSNDVDLRIRGSCQVVNNTASGNGGAIHLSNSRSLAATVGDRSVVSFNGAGVSGGALYLRPREASSLRISGGSSIRGNRAGADGGGIYIGVAAGNVQEIQIDGGSSVSENTAKSGSGGALFVQARVISDMLVDNHSHVENNTAGGSGGAVCLNSSQADSYIGSVTWNNSSTLSGNWARTQGGGLYLAAKTVSVVKVFGSSAWRGNIALGDGGALYVEMDNYLGNFSSITVGGNSQLSSNRAQNGGAVYIHGFSRLDADGESTMVFNTANYDGGAVYFAQLPVEVRLQSCNMSGNAASRGSGGALYIATAEPVWASGAISPSCAFPLQTVKITVMDSSFSRNTAGVADGGAISLKAHERCDDDTHAAIEIGNSLFLENSAAGAGGAIALRDESKASFVVSITNTTFRGNVAGSVNGSSTNRANLGGALLILREPVDVSSNLTASCQLNVFNTSFEANSCDGGTGGAVMLISCASEFSGSTFTANRAILSGGAVGSLHLARSTATLGLVRDASTTLVPATNLLADTAQSVSGKHRRLVLAGDDAADVSSRQKGHRWAEQPWSMPKGIAAGSRRDNSDDEVIATHRKLLDEGDNGSNGISAKWRIRLDDCNFERNSADLEYGGALYLYASSDAGQIQIVNCSFTRNFVVQQHAGAAFLAARGAGTKVQLINSAFDSNIAELDSAGALYALVGSGADIALESIILTQNRAAVSGGACVLDVRSGGALHTYNVTASNNCALGGDGGAVQLHVQMSGSADIVGCVFTDNNAARNGGAVQLNANCSSSLSVQETVMSRNRAGASGGAVYVSYASKEGISADDSAFGTSSLDSPAVSCPDMSMPDQQVSLQVQLTSNIAGQEGGGVFVAPASTLTILNSTLQNNTACGGGGSIAVQNCSALVLRHSALMNSHTMGSGGGLYAFGCRRLLLEYINITGNAAAVSGGGLTIAGIPDDIPNASSSSNNVGTGSVSDYTSAIIHRTQVFENAAGGQPVLGAVASCNVHGSSEQQVASTAGKGGGLFITGKVVSVLNYIDLAKPNYAWFGGSLATTQRCKLANTSSSSGAGAIRIIDPAEIQAWDAFAIWDGLEKMAAMQCWLLQLSDTLLPPVDAPATRSSKAPAAAKEQNLTGSSQQKDLTIWVEDFLASALQVKCSQSPDVETRIRTMAAEESAGRYDGIRQTVSYRLNDTIQKRLVSSDVFALQVLKLLNPAGIIPKAAIVAANSTRFQKLVVQIRDCLSNPSSLSALQRETALKQRPYIGLPPSYMGLQLSGQDLSVSQPLQLQAGVAFNLSAQLFDMFRQRATWDMAPSTSTIALRPQPAVNASSTPWLDADVAFLDPGPKKSLTVPVVNGSVTWSGIAAFAWPGLYSLTLELSVTRPSTVKVAPLEMAVEVLPCQVGDTLDLSRLSYKSSWTGCKTCPPGQYGLWRDDRPTLTAIIASLSDEVEKEEVATTAATGDASIQTLFYLGKLNSSISSEHSSCVVCPDQSLCLGGAVVVPKPGYWHSAANSTQLHACPNAAACKVEGDMRIFPDSVFNAMPEQDYRTKLLSWCQLGWYDSAVPGAAVQQAYFNPRSPLPPSDDDDYDGVIWSPVLLNSNILPSEQNTSVAAASTFPRCLLFGLPAGHPDSYMQQQCAEGYTGNLCAACIPHYYVDSDFNCKKCPTLARTVALGLLSFFSSVILVLFTTIANFAEGFWEQQDGQQAKPVQQKKNGKVAARLEFGDVVKAIVLHLQYLVIVTRVNVDYPNIILRLQAVFSTITGAENYLVYSPSCLVPETDSAGQALIQWLAGILTPCAVAVVSMMLWALRYGFRFRKDAAQVVTDHAHSLRGKVMGVCKSLSARMTSWPSRGRSDTLYRPTDSEDTLAAFPHRPRAESCPTGPTAQPPPGTSSFWPTQDGSSIGLSTVFRDVQVVALDAAAANPKAALATACASSSPSTSHRASEEVLHIVLPTAASTAPVVDFGSADVGCAVNVSKANAPLVGVIKHDRMWHPQARDPAVAAASGDEEQLDCLSEIPEILRGGNHTSRTSVPLFCAASGNFTLQDYSRIHGTPTAKSPGAESDVSVLHFSRQLPYRLSHRKTSKTLSTVGSSALSDAMKTLSRLRTLAVSTQQSSQATFVQVDKAMNLREQLGVVLMAAVFVLYPSWAHAALSTFACYPIDDGEGPFSEAQQATWQYGYWVRNMQAMCYSGNHLRVYVPIGVAAVVVFCLLPPLMSFWFVWRVRGRLDNTHVRKVYGFLYKRYKPRFIWWETILQLETLILVTVEVLGRGLNVSYQALLLLVVFTVIALINVSCAPLLSRMLVIMEFISLGTLSLTITLSLFFTIDDGMNLAAENALAIIIIALNSFLIIIFLHLANRQLWPAAFKKVTTSTHSALQNMFSNCFCCMVKDKAPDGCDRTESGNGNQRLVCWPILSRSHMLARTGTSEAAPAGDVGDPPSSPTALVGRRSLDCRPDVEASDRAADLGLPMMAPSGMGMALASVSLEDQLSDEFTEPSRQIPRPGHVCVRLQDLS